MGTTSSRPLHLRRRTTKTKEDPLALTKHKSAAIPLDSHATVDTWIEEIAARNNANNNNNNNNNSSWDDDNNDYCPSSSLSLSSAELRLATSTGFPTVRIVEAGEDEHEHDDDDDDKSPSTASTTTTTTTTSTTTTTIEEETVSSLKKTTKVQFTTIEQRVYPIVPSDNPSVTGFGPAMALGGWKYAVEPRQTVDDFEHRRKRIRPRRSNHEELRLPAIERRNRLIEQGASRDRLARMAARAQKLKTQRLRTREAYEIYGGQRYLNRLEQLESSKRFVQKMMGLRQGSQQEQAQLWEQAAAAANQNM